MPRSRCETRLRSPGGADVPDLHHGAVPERRPAPLRRRQPDAAHGGSGGREIVDRHGAAEQQRRPGRGGAHRAGVLGVGAAGCGDGIDDRLEAGHGARDLGDPEGRRRRRAAAEAIARDDVADAGRQGRTERHDRAAVVLATDDIDPVRGTHAVERRHLRPDDPVDQDAQRADRAPVVRGGGRRHVGQRLLLQLEGLEGLRGVAVAEHLGRDRLAARDRQHVAVDLDRQFERGLPVRRRIESEAAAGQIDGGRTVDAALVGARQEHMVDLRRSQRRNMQAGQADRIGVGQGGRGGSDDRAGVDEAVMDHQLAGIVPRRISRRRRCPPDRESSHRRRDGSSARGWRAW